MMSVDPLTAVGVMIATAATDAVYVMFTSAVVSRRRVAAATWSSFWYLLSCRLRRRRILARRLRVDHIPASAAWPATGGRGRVRGSGTTRTRIIAGNV
jgi:hypothetical protein